MNCPKKEKRKYSRYETEAKIYFRVNYDIETKVRFQVLDKDRERLLSRKYAALSRNVSVEGLGFSSNRKLRKGDIVYLEVYLPKQAKPIYMTGEVRCSNPALAKQKYNYRFNSGVRLLTVSGKPVTASVYFDKEYQVLWSIVLDSIFGNFRRLMQKMRAKASKSR